MVDTRHHIFGVGACVDSSRAVQFLFRFLSLQSHKFENRWSPVCHYESSTNGDAFTEVHDFPFASRDAEVDIFAPFDLWDSSILFTNLLVRTEICTMFPQFEAVFLCFKSFENAPAGERNL